MSNTHDLSDDALRGLLEEATPGPWSHVNGCMAPDFVIRGMDLTEDVQIVCGSVDCVENVANSQLIALAPSLAFALIESREKNRALREEIAELKPKPKPKPKTEWPGYEETGGYDPSGYCDNPGRGY